MSTCTALMRVPVKAAPAGVVALRRRMFEQAADEAAVRPRVWLEALEPRRMLAAAGVASFPGFTEFDVTDTERGPDGKVYVVGALYDAAAGPGQYGWGVARFNADGSVDSSFGAAGTVAYRGVGESNPNVILFAPGGGFAVVGEAGGEIDVGRFNTDGSPDARFNGGALLRTTPTLPGEDPASAPGFFGYDVAFGGRGGDEPTLIWAENGRVVQTRLAADETRDAAFGKGGWVVTPFHTPPNAAGQAAVADFLDATRRLPDGGLVAYVDVTYGALDGPQQLVRVEADAAGDVVGETAVQLSDSLAPRAHDVFLGADGSAFVMDAGLTSPDLDKLDAAGVLDASFGNGGVVTLDAAGGWWVNERADGRLLVQYGMPNGELLGLNADGSPDTMMNGGQPVAEWTGPFILVANDDGSAFAALSRTDREGRDVAIDLGRIGPDGSQTGLDWDVPVEGGAAVGTTYLLSVATLGDPAPDSAGDESQVPVASGPTGVPAAFVVGSLPTGGTAASIFADKQGATLFDPNGTQLLA